MVQSVYDPDSDELPLHHDAPDPLEQLRGEEAAMEARARSGVDSNAAGPERDPEMARRSSTTKLGLAKAEANRANNRSGRSGDDGGKDYSGENSNAASGSSLYNEAGDEQTGLRGRAGNTRRKIKGRISKLTKHKWLMGFGIGGAGLLGILVLILILIAGALKIPNLAQNVLDYQFARITREYASTSESVTESALGEEALDAPAAGSLKAKYVNAKGNVKGAWEKLDKYRPQKVIQKLGTENNGSMRLNFKNGRFIGGSLNGADFAVTEQGATRFIPVLKEAVSFKNNLQFSREFAPALEAQLKTNGVGAVIRGITARQIRKELGISLVAWNVGKYQGKNASEARIQETRDKVADVDGESGKPPVVEGKTGELNDAENAGATAAEEELSTDAGVQAIIKNGGVSQKAKDAITKSLQATKLDKVLNFADPLSAAIPMCIVYDGSLEESGPVIDEQVRQSQGAFYYLATAADQEKYGSNGSDVDNDGLANAVGATNDDLGQIEQSIAYNRANGTDPSTASVIGPEASAGGDFTLINAIPGMSSTVAAIINGVGEHLCSKLTSTSTIIGLSLANILAQLVPGEDVTVDGLESAGKTTANDVIQKETDTFATRLLLKLPGEKTAGYVSKTGNLLYDSGKSIGKIIAATLLAKLIVNERAGQLNNGTTQGTDLANEADVGGNLHANELARTQNFGRPLSQTEVCQAKQDDSNELGYENSQKSIFNRYLSTSNPTSALSQTAIDFSANMNSSLANRLFKLGSDVLRPSTLFGAFSHLLFGRTYAASDCDAVGTDYGNVQFGWSDDEEKLWKSDDSYTMLNNQQILDDSGQEGNIAKAYANCFGYTYNPNGDGSFDPTDENSDMQLAIAGSDTSGSLGTLLAKGEITRDSDGNVQGSVSQPNGKTNNDQNSCAPGNLSYHNNQYGDQMVFRFRLAERFFVGVDTATAEQDATSSSSQSGDIQQ